jgi:hypothetical protein
VKDIKDMTGDEAVDYLVNKTNKIAEEFVQDMDEIFSSGMSRSQTDLEIYEQSRQAYERVKQRRDFADWLIIGEGLLAMRQEAFATTQVSETISGRYRREFTKILRREKLDDIAKIVRTELLNIMEHLDEINEWLMSLPDYERVKLNYPTHVWRRYKGLRQKHSRKRLDSAKQVRQELELAQETIKQQEEQVVELEQSKEQFKTMVDSRDNRIADLEATIIKLQARIKQLEGRRSREPV